MDVRRIAPGLGVLRGYDRSYLRGDVLGGLTVAAYGIPQVMAYAEITGLPAVTGLMAMIGPLLVYVLLGSSRRLSVGPESTTALMTATAVAPLMATLPEDRRSDATALLALMVAAVAFAGWALRLGFLARLLSKPVLVGYLVGICVLMIVSQLGKVTGLKVSGDGLPAQVMSVARQFGSVHVPTVTLAGVVVVVLFALRHFLPRWPGPLLVVVGASAAVHFLDLPVRLTGTVEGGLPLPGLPDVGGIDWTDLVGPAIAIALVGYSDNVLTSRAFGDRHGDQIDPNSEMLALGGTNLLSGLSHGFPVSSSGSRTALGDSMGVRTQAFSLVAAATIVLVLLFARPLIAEIPTAALGGLVVYAAIRLVDLPEIRRLAAFRTSEVVLAGVTAVGVVLTDVLVGIGVAVALSAIDLLRRIADPHDGVLGFVPGLAGMHDIDDHPTATTVPGLLMYRYDAPLFFANAEHFALKARHELTHETAPVKWFVLNAEAISEIDLTACDELERLRSDLEAQGIVFGLARVKHELFEQLERAGFIDKVGRDHVYATLPTAVAAYREATGTPA
ncbi:MAG: SulP family inorganic anion transporter [Dermatophilus congolensis]|nr:SulP family inorganic anion transporter [Dermatophilus congolensis]